MLQPAGEGRGCTCCTAPPTDVGSAEAMLAKMRMEVPLPSFISEIVSATCSFRLLVILQPHQHLRGR